MTTQRRSRPTARPIAAPEAAIFNIIANYQLSPDEQNNLDIASAVAAEKFVQDAWPKVVVLCSQVDDICLAMAIAK